MTKTWGEMNIFQKIWKVITTINEVIHFIVMFIGVMLLDTLILAAILYYPLTWLLENIHCN